MIPLKLQIKNFLSYGSELQTINFEPYQLICLSGKNGHGKSALLDAMAWAIWGEARKTTGTSKPDQGLLRLGQRNMVVIFDFEFNKNKYRIKREFTFAYGKPYANLEFAMYNLDKADDEKLISLTDKTIRATQDKIESMIGLNFESFCNSAFLRQGSSNEFSKKSSKDRKEILANILGLGKFEELRKSALEKIKNITQEYESNLKLNEHLEKELTLFNEVNSNLLQTKEAIESITKDEQTLIKQKNNIEDEKKNYNAYLNEFKLLDFQLKKFNQDIETSSKELVNIYNSWHENHKKRISFADKEKIEKVRYNLLKDIETFQKLQHEELILKEQFLKLKESEQILFNKLNEQQTIETQKKSLELERLLINKAHLQTKIKELNNNVQLLLNEQIKTNSELKNNIELINNKIDEKTISNLEKKFDKHRNFYQKLIAQGNVLKSELSALDQKKKLSFDEQNPSCPLCEQNLSASRKKFLKQQFANQELLFKKRIERIAKVIPQIKEYLLIQHEEIKRNNAIVDNNKICKNKVEELNKQILKINDQLQSLDNQNKDLIKDLENCDLNIDQQKKSIEFLKVESTKLIEENLEYKNLKNGLEVLNKQISESKYNAQEHKESIANMANIDAILNDININQVMSFIERYKSEFEKVKKSIRLMQQDKNEIEQKLKSFADLNVLEQKIIIKEQEINELIKILLKNKEILFGQHGSLENQKTKLEQIAIDCEKNKKNLTQFQEQINDFKIISTALSKDGIQALLIEESIPEIENEANILLAKLTDNQAQIIIDSVRDLKKGGIKETLDIKISDGVGIRPYEMFSGGEAFRIDFALRIAISKLLARRTGTSLQTLIIDEGFGSQDEEGLNNIMDSIYKIQEDFAKVIIVSHLPTMKEQFPVHFVVEKGATGSKVSILEQG